MGDLEYAPKKCDVRWEHDSNPRHQLIIDPEDRRFKVCIWCGRSFWRETKELLEEAGVKDGKD